MAELEQQYITEIESFSEVSLSLGNWLPRLNIRPLIPATFWASSPGLDNSKAQRRRTS